jgi:diguanylate cyclase (GGDEF)-like protein
MIAGSRIAAVAAVVAAAAFAVAPARAERRVPIGPLAQTFAVYGVEEGLPSLSTTDLVLDAGGSLWVGTQEGVVRFDGERFHTFGALDGLPSGFVFALEVDGGDTLWAATLKGLARFDGQRFVAVELPGSPAGEAVEALGRDADGRLVAGALGGAWSCDAARGCRRTFALPADQFVSAIALDARTRELWLAGSFGLVRWREHELERWTTAEGLPSHATRALLVDRFGMLWLRQIHAIVRLDTAERRLEVVREVEIASDVTDLLEDRDGALWAASDHGLWYLDAARRDGWRRIGVENGLPGDGVAAVLEDGEGALWIGTAYAGLARWLGRDRFSAWTVETGLPNEVVWSVARATDGTLGFGTQEGLALVAPGSRELVVVDRADGLDSDVVLTLAADEAGGFWIGTAAGLVHRDRAGRVVDAAARSGFPESLSVTSIAVAPGGRLWLGTTIGLWSGEGAPGEIVFRRVGLPAGRDGGAPEAPAQEAVFDLLLDPSGTLWVAGRYGLARLENGEWSRLTRADGLQDDFLSSLARAADGAIWVGYRDAHGVSELRWQGASPVVRHHGRADGLRHEQATFVRADALGRIWVGTTRGVSVRTARGFVGFTRSDGLLSEDTCTNAFLADQDGTAWIGTPRGAIAARLSRDDLRPRPPLEARILSVDLGGRAYAPEIEPRVPAAEAAAEIAFAARSFRAPGEVEFRYQLLGVDASPVTTRIRSARYPALGPGSHQFVVSARLAGGDWGPPATSRFEVAPAWWATVPARLGALVVFAGAGLLLDRARTRRQRQRREGLEAAVAERTRELAASREELARKNDELAHLSLTDPLTGLKNRRYAWEYLAQEVARVDREWRSAPSGATPEARLVFFLVDVDLFKNINDLHGHEIGDRILIEAAERVREATRISDVAVRWGGEEFLVVARDLPPSEWSSFASRLRTAISKPSYVPSPEIGPVTCTASLGYAAYPFHPSMELGWQQVLRMADLALYAVKQCGRDADLGVEPGPGWKGTIPADLLAAQASDTVRLRWGNVSRGVRV